MRSKLYLGAVLMAAVAPAAMATPLGSALAIQSGSRVWVEGTSTVRGWRCESGRVEGRAVTGGEATTVISELQGSVTGAEVTIPLATLDCSNGTMNDHMRKAMKAAENPVIRYRVTSHQTRGTESEGTIRMSGTLTLAGQDQPVTVDATASRDAEGNLRVRGSRQLRMTEFGVQPPRLMMGTLRVSDPVTVSFDVVLKP